jgi:aspartate/tyrosine/aromatic aminotransferase
MERLNYLKISSQLVAQTPDLFPHVDMAPKDPIIWTREAFARDESEEKVNLGQGVYRDNDCKPYVFAVVRKVE